jgi:hypothetical protein
LPVSPYRWPDAACIGNLVAFDPLELNELSRPWIDSTTEYLLANHFHQGLFFQSVFHTGLNPYLTAQVARVLVRNEDPRAMNLINAISNAASSSVTWPEAINPRTQGGCMGDGDHGWAAAEFCNVLRQVLVLEDPIGLTLFQGIQHDWMQPGATTSISNAPTLHGRMTASLECSSTGVWARWRLEPWPGEETTQVTISLPRGLTEIDTIADPTLSQKRSRIRVSLRGEKFFAHTKGAAI